MTIKKISRDQVVTASCGVSIQEVAKLMKQHNIGDVIIINEAKGNIPIGMITNCDIVTKAIANEVDLKKIAASDIMSEDLLVLKEHQGIKQCFAKRTQWPKINIFMPCKTPGLLKMLKLTIASCMKAESHLGIYGISTWQKP